MHRNDPNGGYLFRFELKFESGNDSLLFVATDRSGEISRGRPAWYVYRKQPRSAWKQIAINEMIDVDEFYVDHPTRTIVQHYPDGFGDGMNFSTLKINPDGSVEKKYYPSEKIDDALRKKLEKQGSRFVPEVEKVTFGAYLRAPDLKWRPLDRSHAVAAQSLDVGDTALLAASSNLTWTGAVELGKALTNHPSESLLPARTNSVRSGNTNLHSPAPILRTNPSALFPSQKSDVSP